MPRSCRVLELSRSPQPPLPSPCPKHQHQRQLYKRQSLPRRQGTHCPTLDKYNGKNKAAYPAFKGYLHAKLRIDQVVIRGKLEQVQYAFRQLANKVADYIFPQIKLTKQREAPLQVTTFFKQLDTAFYDPQIPQRALEQINNKKQGSTPF